MKPVKESNTFRYTVKRTDSGGAITWKNKAGSTGASNTLVVVATAIANAFTITNPASLMKQKVKLGIKGRKSVTTPMSPAGSFNGWMEGYLYFKNTANASPTANYFQQHAFRVNARVWQAGAVTTSNLSRTASILHTVAFTQGLKVNTTGKQKAQLWIKITGSYLGTWDTLSLVVGVPNNLSYASRNRIEGNQRFFNK